MRKSIKIGIILLILGLGLTMFGIANNGLKAVYWENGFKISRQTHKTTHLKSIKSLTLATSANVTVKEGTQASVEVTSHRNAPVVKADDGHVTVRGQSNYAHEAGFFVNDYGTDQVVVTVPKQQLKKIVATSDQVGDLSFEDLSVKQLDLSTSALADIDVSFNNVIASEALNLQTGDLTLKNVQAPSITAKTGDLIISASEFKAASSKFTVNDGDVSVQQSTFKNLQLQTTDGDIDLGENHLKGQLIATTHDGDISLTAPKHVGVTADNQDGDLSIFGWHSDDQHHYQANKKAKQQYHLTTTDGDISVIASN